MTPEHVSTRVIACPQCGATPARYVEVGTVTTTFDAALGRRAAEGYHAPGDVTHVLGKCNCGHSWRLRGVRQITDLDTP